MQDGSRSKATKRITIFAAAGPLATLALTLSVILGRIESHNLDAVTGFFVGLSIAGNLIYISVISRHLRRIGGCHD